MSKRTTRILESVSILAVVAGYLSIYIALAYLVGRFPAESFAVSRSDSAAMAAFCYDPNDEARNIALRGTKLGHAGATMLSLPVIGQPRTAGDLGQLAASRALFYSADDNTIYVINPLDTIDVAHLKSLAFWKIIRASDATRIHAQAASFAPSCPDPVTDRGITEGYWASKGTAVVHHWAFLYDASVADGKPVHAQYGRLVSRMARWLAQSLGQNGPSSFVRAAWAIYCCLGLVYIAAFAYTFRGYPAVAGVGLACQLAAFVAVDAFSITLAPGYHWSRELVMIVPAVVFASLPRPAPLTPQKRVIAIALVFAAGAGCFALDPTFSLVAIASSLLALAVRYQKALRTATGKRPFQIGAVLCAGLVLIVVLLRADASNIWYITYMTGNIVGTVFSDPSRTPVIIITFTVAAIMLVLAAFEFVSVITAYFAFISVAVYTYYVITPDAPHFAKYVEYVVPVYVAVAVDVLRVFGRALRARSIPFAAALLLITFTVLGNSVPSIVAAPKNWELRTFDMFGSPYFSPITAIVNHRTIEADLNERTIRRLQQLPSAVTDYIISPLDKYVLFLYDRHNGLDVVDGESLLASDAQLNGIQSTIIGRHASVLIDTDVFTVNPLAGILSTHPVMGQANDQSVINTKERIRTAELAEYLSTHCATSPEPKTTFWIVAHC